MCLYPKIIENRRYVANKKNGGVIPAMFDIREKYVEVPCMRCMECMRKKANNWKVRLLEEIKDNKGIGVTLTFSTESLIEFEKLREINRRSGYEKDIKIAKIAVRRFCERWRKATGKSIRHWLVTELGSGRYEHLHLHGILFTNEDIEVIKERWGYGYIHKMDWMNEATVSYYIKYIHKIDEKHKEFEPIVLCSQGIGKGYIDKNKHRFKYKKDESREYYKDGKGLIYNLPDYYKKKLYNEDERTKLWMDKLDKGIKYVNGIKINVSKDDTHYNKVIEEERLKNKRLGYNNGYKDREKRMNENLEREKIQKKRLERILIIPEKDIEENEVHNNYDIKNAF